jgi:DNA replication protein DnaC
VPTNGWRQAILAQCLGSTAVRASHSMVFSRADALFKELLQARAHHTLDKTFRRFIAPELLVLDDFGLQRLTAR